MSGRYETLSPVDHVTRVSDLQDRNRPFAKPNVYRRSQEARENTNAYLAAMEQKAAKGDVEPPTKEQRNRAIKAAVVILLSVAIIVAVWIF